LRFSPRCFLNNLYLSSNSPVVPFGLSPDNEDLPLWTQKSISSSSHLPKRAVFENSGFPSSPRLHLLLPSPPQTMTDLSSRLSRWSTRLSSLPSLALPTDYPRPSPPRVVESVQTIVLSPSHLGSLDKLSSSSALSSPSPTPFQLLLTSFILLLHRYTPDPSLLICTSAKSSNGSSTPLLLLINIGEGETFASLLKQVIEVEEEAKRDAVPLDELEKEIKRTQPERGEGPLFRVRFLDESDSTSPSSVEASMGLETDMTLVYGKDQQTGGELFRASKFLPLVNGGSRKKGDGLNRAQRSKSPSFLPSFFSSSSQPSSTIYSILTHTSSPPYSSPLPLPHLELAPFLSLPSSPYPPIPPLPRSHPFLLPCRLNHHLHPRPPSPHPYPILLPPRSYRRPRLGGIQRSHHRHLLSQRESSP